MSNLNQISVYTLVDANGCIYGSFKSRKEAYESLKNIINNNSKKYGYRNLVLLPYPDDKYYNYINYEYVIIEGLLSKNLFTFFRKKYEENFNDGQCSLGDETGEYITFHISNEKKIKKLICKEFNIKKFNYDELLFDEYKNRFSILIQDNECIVTFRSFKDDEYPLVSEIISDELSFKFKKSNKYNADDVDNADDANDADNANDADDADDSDNANDSNNVGVDDDADDDANADKIYYQPDIHNNFFVYYFINRIGKVIGQEDNALKWCEKIAKENIKRALYRAKRFEEEDFIDIDDFFNEDCYFTFDKIRREYQYDIAFCDLCYGIKKTILNL